uniref:EF-hand domain-containing family member B n=1 Tax=Schizaphis graminum TaxID=13262 RepID=A0A2S2NCC1_SCHGA
MKPFNVNDIRDSNYSQLQGKCLEPDATIRCSSNYDPLVQNKNFNDPLLPNDLDKNTVYGIITKSKLSAGDVIFPNKLFRENGIEDKKETDLYKISHHTYGISEKLNRKYTNSFDPDYRYGKPLKRLPAGVWFKNNVQAKSSNENQNMLADYISKLLESKENTHCRYPYIDNRQGKFVGRSYLRAQDVLTGNEPDKKDFERIDYSSTVIRLKHYIKEKKCDLRELHETFKLFDKVSALLLYIFNYNYYLNLVQLYKIRQ